MEFCCGYAWCLLLTIVSLCCVDYGYSKPCMPETFKMCKNFSIPNTAQHFVIQSENFGAGTEGYNANLKCHLQLDERPEPVIAVLQFQEFDIEYEFSCEYDSLEIAGKSYCGHWLKGRALKVLLQPFKILEFIFTTDNSISRHGFSILVDVVPYLEGENVREYIGKGSRASNDFQFVVYSSTQPVVSRYYYEAVSPAAQYIKQQKFDLLGFLDSFPRETQSDQAHVSEDADIVTFKPMSSQTVEKEEDGSKWFGIVKRS